MSGGAREPDAGVPASIAAIMAAIRQEVIAPPAGPAPSEPAAAGDEPPDPPAAPPSVPPALRAGAAVALPATLDDEARALLAPMLRDWLDAHLPEIVEAAVDAEIRRLTGLNDSGNGPS